MAGWTGHPLGDLFGLKNFGVNLTRLAPGTVSALYIRHSRQDEFIYVIEGRSTLTVGDDEMQLRPVMVGGFASNRRWIIWRAERWTIAWCWR